jgi:beta-aspartyl-peptidase (threonine type)
MEYKGMSLHEAASLVIQKKIHELGGDGGLIAVDAKGAITMSFNTEGMYRAYKTSAGKEEVLIYND